MAAAGLFHSDESGTANPSHISRDTSVNRVLISDDFVYFGGEGPLFPENLRDQEDKPLCKSGIGRSRFEDAELTAKLERWIRDFGISGFQGPPMEWISLRG